MEERRRHELMEERRRGSHQTAVACMLLSFPVVHDVKVRREKD